VGRAAACEREREARRRDYEVGGQGRPRSLDPGPRA